MLDGVSHHHSINGIYHRFSMFPNVSWSYGQVGNYDSLMIYENVGLEFRYPLWK